MTKKSDLEMAGLTIYRSMLRDHLVGTVSRLACLFRAGNAPSPEEETLISEVAAELFNRAEGAKAGENLWQNYLIALLAEDVNPFSRAASRWDGPLEESSIFQAATVDLAILKRLFDFQFSGGNQAGCTGIVREILCYRPVPAAAGEEADFYRSQVRELKRNFAGTSSPQQLAAVLANFYRSTGCGKFGRYRCLRWDGEQGLMGISHPDPIILDDLIGYAYQKETIIQNTEAFLQGHPANNLLLYGDRGTGKSSTIKGLVNTYASRGLRLLEVPRNQLHRLMDAVGEVRDEPQRFILFIDDLSFEGSETEYKYLKALMEGGVEVIPANVLIYATSNRRHLVQETWTDRNQAGGEIHAADAMAEKFSLSDRFGLTVTFASPDQEEFLRIVQGLAGQYGIKMPRAELRERALQWERWYNGRSGRTARQFVHSLLALPLDEEAQDLN